MPAGLDPVIAARRQARHIYPREHAGNWLGNLDSNQDKQSQSLLCYRYTIPQRNSRTNSMTY